jgi:hypothetical protein
MQRAGAGIIIVAALLAAAGCSRTDESARPAVSQTRQVPAPPRAADPSDPAPPPKRPPPKVEPVASKPAEIKPAAIKPVETQPLAMAAEEEKPAKVDPVKLNGPIFEGWKKPELSIVITGEQAGYLEPCGCAGLENQKGGLSRRDTLLRQLRKEGWPLLLIDLGGLVSRFGPQAEIKFQTAVDALRAMDYTAIGWSPEDLRLGGGILLSATTEQDGKPTRFVSANVGLFELDLDSPDRFRVGTWGGKRIAVTSILGKAYQQGLNSDEIKVVDPAEALSRVVPKMTKAADLAILLSYAPPAESEALAKKFPQFQVVVTAGGSDEPPREPRRAGDTGAMLIELGHKGMYAITLGLYPSTPKLRYQRVPLDARFGDSPAMKELMVAYQHQLKALGWEGLGLRPIVHPNSTKPGDSSGQFAGSEACAKCHKTAYGIWKDTPHAHATASLAKLDPPRQFDPECISCHATGWKPQEFIPYETGFTSLEATPLLAGNGCENCHGPAKGHLEAEAGKDLALRTAMRKALHLTADDNSCLKCHDLDNSPEFDFSTYWPQVEHHGKD